MPIFIIEEDIASLLARAVLTITATLVSKDEVDIFESAALDPVKGSRNKCDTHSWSKDVDFEMIVFAEFTRQIQLV